MNTIEVFRIAMLIVFSVPCLIWRLGRTEYVAPLVVVQIATGIRLGPGILGALFPGYHRFVFSAPVSQSLNGVAWWAAMVFAWIAGIGMSCAVTALPILILILILILPMEKPGVLRRLAPARTIWSAPSWPVPAATRTGSTRSRWTRCAATRCWS